jgi:hypothetical protein
MDDTTDLIQALAQQVVSAAKEWLTQTTEPGAATNLAWIETALRDVLRPVGAEALGQWLSAAQHTPEAARPCVCGGTLRYQRSRPATVLRVLGRVTYERGVRVVRAVRRWMNRMVCTPVR